MYYVNIVIYKNYIYIYIYIYILKLPEVLGISTLGKTGGILLLKLSEVLGISIKKMNGCPL